MRQSLNFFDFLVSLAKSNGERFSMTITVTSYKRDSDSYRIKLQSDNGGLEPVCLPERDKSYLTAHQIIATLGSTSDSQSFKIQISGPHQAGRPLSPSPGQVVRGKTLNDFLEQLMGKIIADTASSKNTVESYVAAINAHPLATLHENLSKYSVSYSGAQATLLIAGERLQSGQIKPAQLTNSSSEGLTGWHVITEKGAVEYPSITEAMEAIDPETLYGKLQVSIGHHAFTTASTKPGEMLDNLILALTDDLSLPDSTQFMQDMDNHGYSMQPVATNHPLYAAIQECRAAEELENNQEPEGAYF